MRLICFSPVTSQNGNSVQEKKVIAQTVSVGEYVLACKYVLVLSYQTLDCRGVGGGGGGEVGKIRFFFSSEVLFLSEILVTGHVFFLFLSGLGGIGYHLQKLSSVTAGGLLIFAP